MLRRGVRRRATTGLAVALGLGLAALAGSQEERPLLSYGHDSYRLLRGPEGVMWCPRQALPGLRAQSMLQLVDPFSLRQVALGHDGDAQPVLEVPFPVCNDNRLFTFSLGPDYRLYYADGLLDLREGMFPEGCFVRLYAYVSPAEVAAFTQDPSRCPRCPCSQAAPIGRPSRCGALPSRRRVWQSSAFWMAVVNLPEGTQILATTELGGPWALRA